MCTVAPRLEEGGIVTRCEITTYEPEGLLDLAFPDSDKVQRMIIKVRPTLSVSVSFSLLADG